MACCDFFFFLRREVGIREEQCLEEMEDSLVQIDGRVKQS